MIKNDDILKIMRDIREEVNPEISLITRINDDNMIKASLILEHDINIPFDLFKKNATISEGVSGIVVSYKDYSLTCSYYNEVWYQTAFHSYKDNMISTRQPNSGSMYTYNRYVKPFLEIINKTFRTIHEKEIKEC